MSRRVEIWVVAGPIVFEEVIKTYQWALSSLGYLVSTVERPSGLADMVLAIGSNWMPPGSTLPKKTVVLNFEHYPDWKPHLPDMYRGHEIWNYDQVVHERFQAAGLRSRCVPFGWSPALNSYRSLPRTTEFDVAFVGSHNEERGRRLELLRKAGLKLVASTSLWGEERALAIAKSKIVLSIRSQKDSPFMGVRIVPMWAMKSPVLCDEFEGMQHHPGIDQAMHLVPSEDDAIVEGALRLCKDEALRQEFAIKGLAYAKAHPILPFIEEALQEHTW